MSVKFSKKDIIAYLESAKVGLSPPEAKKIVENFFNIIIKETKEENKIKFHLFGSFERVNRASKSARDFKTNTILKTRPYKTIKFKYSKNNKKIF